VHLKTLSIKGFKSFADATSLELEPGVTVVVGPNGSGKSNVVDAIAWVLGAQAPSAVRSQKMDDVIFAGTDKRAALGRAEVSLTIDNTDGQMPIEFNEVTVTRTLFRSGESEYAINGAPVRLMDIQELLSDAGVGRQQHVIISQGQIDAVLNAKPEERRLVIEEAAGVLKFRKRKEKSERRLAATETNLVRLQDLLREVRRQLRPLERQADAARRHGDLIAELNALRLHVAGRELTARKAQLDAHAANRAQLTATERELKASLAHLDTAVLAAEAELSASGGDDLGDALADYESLHERARGLSNLLAERRRGLERERSAFVDQGVIFTLEAESTRLEAELAEVEVEAGTLAPLQAELAQRETELEAQRERFERDWAEGVVAPSSQAAEIRGQLAALRASAERGDAETARVESRLTGLRDKVARLGAEVTRLAAQLAHADTNHDELVEATELAVARREQAELALADAAEAQRSADADQHAWAARADALALALDEARARAGAERLADVDGVLGTLLDLVDVDPGWEPAFEAAAGDALSAVVIDSVQAGRAALGALAAESLSGAVLAVQATRATAVPTTVGESVRAHVRGRRSDVDGLLDTLLANAVAIDGGWSEALDAALAHPDAVVVTRSGDRFGRSGWRLGVGGTGATGAALDEARQRAEGARQTATGAAHTADSARAELDDARTAEAAARRRVEENLALRNGSAEGLARVEGDRVDAQAETEGLEAHLAELLARSEREQTARAELEAALPALEEQEQANATRGRQMGVARAELEEHAAAVGGLRTDVEVRTMQIEERRQFLTRRLGELDERLTRSAVERAEAEQRRRALDARAVATDRLSAEVAERAVVIERNLAELRDRRRRQSEATRAVAARLDGLRRERHDAEVALAELRERQQRLELDEAETRLRIETAIEALRRDLDTEPDVAMAAECPPLAEGVTPPARVRELERELRIMGPINPLALAEFDELKERHDFLEKQLADVRESRRELHKIIRAVDEEIVSVFAAAFADVSQNFTDLFAVLFPGGTGRLKLTAPDNLLETGVEVEAKPSGKNVKKLSLLSGGERSLTALAYLFAVFRARPSPFYVMDEVEAALDDVNLHRFIGLVNEFRQEAQLVIVSHQKRTMDAADVLYGVTMQPGGSSKVVSEKIAAGA
jgi:chromosome segregation protein